MDYQDHGNGSDHRRLPRTIAESVSALGCPLARPADTHGSSLQIETRSSDRSPDTDEGWADAITVICATAPLRITTERRDRREIDLATAARESLSSSWPAPSADDMETWMRERTAALDTVPVLSQSHAATIDDHAYPGARARHSDIAAWAVDLDDIRISVSGPATVIDQLALELSRT